MGQEAMAAVLSICGCTCLPLKWYCTSLHPTAQSFRLAGSSTCLRDARTAVIHCTCSTQVSLGMITLSRWAAAYAACGHSTWSMKSWKVAGEFNSKAKENSALKIKIAELEWSVCNDSFNCRILESIQETNKHNLKKKQLGSRCFARRSSQIRNDQEVKSWKEVCFSKAE